VLITYLENLKDWNVSRQIAWGIPIPAFQNINDSDDWIFDEAVTEEIIERNGQTYRRDPDVFDTWFSSGQWPFATLRYPDHDDYKRFYPLSVMETGYDILMPWVSRMIMLGLYVTDQAPFKDVYLHGLVLDPEGQKMSKSKGNVVNPTDVLEQYGSDALRMGLLQGRSAGQNQPFTEDKVIGARNFANKLWNVARFVEGVLGDDYQYQQPELKTDADHWIAERLNRGNRDIAKAVEEYRFAEAYELLYHLVWDDFADWYVEVSKTHQNAPLLAYGLETILTLAHPFAPFITETIWQTLTWTTDMIALNQWPEELKVQTKRAQAFHDVQTVVTEIRELKQALKLRENTLYHTGSDFIAANKDVLVALTGIAGCEVVDSGYGLHLTKTEVEAWLDVEHDVIRDYVATLTNQLEVAQQQAAHLQGRLDNKSYVKNAPKELVAETKQQLQAQTELIDRTTAQISNAEDSLRAK
jgi:valyl-tRNA synthetase